MGLLIGKDAQVMQKYFKEMSKLIGIPVEYVYPVEEDITIHAEIKSKFSSFYNIDIVFDTNPAIKTLKNYGWVSENRDDKPYIGYFPIDTPEIQTKARIKITPIGVEKKGKWFEITDIQHAIEYPTSYACRLVPVFETEPEQLNYSHTNNNYLTHNNQPDQSNNHIKEINKNLEKHIEDNLKKEINETINENFKYLDI